jgi:hypothetical protein
MKMKHKTALVSALSIAGVVLAGAAALAANLGIMNSTNEVGALSAAGSSTSTTTAALGSEVVAYQIAGVGVVTLSRAGSSLSLESAAVGDWTYEVDESGDEIEITFRLGDREIEFKAEVANGQTLVSVTEEDVIVQGSTGTAGVTAPTTAVTSSDGSGDDDDQFEGHDDEDHEDESDQENEVEHEDEDEVQHADDDD